MNEVEDIKNRLDIVDVIGGYIQLKPAGRNFKALSPFRQEKTPSFMVSPDKGIWHDFSAGEGGDIFSFVMRMEGITFVEALELLAKRAGVSLSKRSVGERTDNSRLYDAVESAMKYFHLALSKNQPALDYLIRERALTKDIIKRFVLGYAPDNWDGLAQYLMSKGYKLDELKRAGLISQKSTPQKAYDIFRDRIMFPIFDNQSRAVGFSARILHTKPDSAKYINTAQTAIYDKSNVVYGLMQAKDAIRTRDEVVVVEGNMDVVGLSQAEQANVVAVSGTALSVKQLKILARLTKNIKLCFDQDEAGLRATRRAIELGSGLDINLLVITFSGAKDPDELVKTDKKAWEQAVDSAQYALDYLFAYTAKTYDLSSANGLKQASSFLLPLLKSLSDEVERDHYMQRLSVLLGVSEQSLYKKLAHTKELAEPAPSDEPAPSTPVPADSPPLSRAEQIEENLLELLLSTSSTRACLVDLDDATISERHRDVFELLQNHSKASLDTIAKALPDRANDVKILAFKGEQKYRDLNDHDKRLEAYTQLHRLQKLNLELNKRRLARQIAQAEAVKDKALAQELLQKYQSLLSEE